MVLLFLLVQVIACGHTCAQKVSYTRYDTRDGLSAATVYCITQDKDGYIWFGTETGLSRFDGTYFRNFTVADGLPGNEVFSVFTDSRNRVWMMCFENEICYYHNGKIYNRRNNATLAKIKLKGSVNCIAENESGKIFIKSPNEIYTISDTTVNVVKDIAPGKPNSNYMADFNAISGTGSIAVSIVNIPGYVKRQAIQGALTSIPARVENPYNSRLPYYVCHPPFYTAKKNHIYLFNEQDTLGKTIAAPVETSNLIVVSGPVYAFLRTHNGVTFYDMARQQISGNYLGDYTIQYVIEDAEKNLWFATKGAGVIKISHALFRNYTFDNMGVRYIQGFSGKLFIGTDNGGFRTLPVIKNIADEAVLNTGAIGPEGRLSTITRHTNNAYINYASSDFLHIGKHSNISSIKSLHVNHDTILVATSANCIRISQRTWRIIDTLYQGRTTCAYYYHGKYYIGTLAGLLEVLPGKTITSLSDKYPVLKCQINQISSGNDGTLWIATNASGIAGYKDGRIIANIRLTNGLTSDLCRCLYIDGNTIWAGTDKGLNKISSNNGRYTVTEKFTTADGLNADLVNTVYSKDAFVYVGTPLGLTVFDDTQTPQHATCKVVLEGIIVSNKAIDPSQKDAVLNSQDNNIRFTYSGISFLSGGNIYYRYRLLGLKDQWVTTNENHLDYPSLPANQYKLQLQAVNKFGNKSNLVEYSFEIEKTITERTWFQMAVLLIIIAITSWIASLIVKRAHRKEQEKVRMAQKMVELEQMALRAQMNPHFIFNCLNSMQHYIVNQDVRSANFYLTRFARLVRQTLDNSSRVNITVEEEILYLKNYLELERLQVSGGFTYHIAVSELIDQQKMLIPNMVLQPYVENAIKHGVSQAAQEGFIAITFNLPEKKVLECIIEDNGPGINAVKDTMPTTENQQLHGMSITNKRIKTLDQLNPQHPAIYLHIEDISQPGNATTGTRVIIRFPV